MDILQAEIGCDQGFVASGNSEDGTVIPNSDSPIQTTAASFGFPADAGNQRFFRQWQGAINIARAGLPPTYEGNVPYRSCLRRPKAFEAQRPASLTIV
jgi:hypothetical protein